MWFLSVWMAKWIFSWTACANCFLHISHVVSLQNEWPKGWCFLRLSGRVNCLSHTSYVCGIFPVWTTNWFLRLLACVKCFLHISHVYVFSPEWMNKWVLILLAYVNCFFPISLVCDFSPEWMTKFVCLCCGFTVQSTTRSCRAGQLIVVLF